MRLKYGEHEGEHHVKSKKDSHGVKSKETVTTVNLRASSNTSYKCFTPKITRASSTYLNGKIASFQRFNYYCIMLLMV